MVITFFEKIFSFLFILFFGPVYILIALLVWFDSKGSIFYASVRLGRGKRPFKVYKFRTMYSYVDPELMKQIRESREWKDTRKLTIDPRITRVGRFIRRYSLDELPQIFNVLLGDMSLIGPRPITREENQLYGKYGDLIHSVKPGITGLWQVSGRNLLSYRRRIAINVYYVKHKSLKLDLWILYKTFWTVLSGWGAF